MKNHLSLVIHRHTAAVDVIDFLRLAHATKGAGNSHFRAVEKTIVAAGGQVSTVKILYVRSGRETPLQWFSRLWNRKQEYALAARVLSYGLLDMPRYRPYVPEPMDKGSDFRQPVFQAALKHAKAGVAVSTTRDLFAAPGKPPARTLSVPRA